MLAPTVRLASMTMVRPLNCALEVEAVGYAVHDADGGWGEAGTAPSDRSAGAEAGMGSGQLVQRLLAIFTVLAA